MKFLAIFLLTLGTCSAAEPLSEERLKEIIAADHDANPLVAELQIYPKARAYEIEVKDTNAKGEERQIEATATEKWVEGRYIVSEFQQVGGDFEFAMVVEFGRYQRTETGTAKVTK